MSLESKSNSKDSSSPSQYEDAAVPPTVINNNNSQHNAAGDTANGTSAKPNSNTNLNTNATIDAHTPLESASDDFHEHVPAAYVANDQRQKQRQQHQYESGSRNSSWVTASSRQDSNGSANIDNSNSDGLTRTRTRRDSMRRIFISEVSDSDNDDESGHDLEHQNYGNTDIMGTLQLSRTLGGDGVTEGDEEANADGSDADTESKQEEIQKMPSLRKRRSTIIEQVKQKFGFWDRDFRKERWKQIARLGALLVFISCLFMMVVLVYTGSYYNRYTRFHNLKFYVVSEDQEYDGVPPLIGNLVTSIANDPATKSIGNWQAVGLEEFRSVAARHGNGNNLEKDLKRRIRHGKVWGAIYVKPNATYLLYRAITTNSSSFNVSQNLVDALYATGKEPLNVPIYVLPQLNRFEQIYLKQLSKGLYDPLINKVLVPNNELDGAIGNSNALKLLSSPPNFYYNDTLPITSIMVIPAIQLAMVYILLFAFFGFLSSLKIHIYVSKKVKGFRFIAFRMLTSQSIYIILGLSYCSLNAMFKVPYATAFGKAGFLVLWAITYLAINAVGTINECMAMICFYIFPPLIGPWILTWIVLNITPTFSLIPLCPIFYRYGYAVPIHNFYQCLIVIFCDSYKGDLGRHIGILVAWCIVGNICVPLTQMKVGKLMKHRRAREAKKLQEKKEKGKEKLAR